MTLGRPVRVPRELDGGLDRLGAGVAEEHLTAPADREP